MRSIWRVNAVPVVGMSDNFWPDGSVVSRRLVARSEISAFASAK